MYCNLYNQGRCMHFCNKISMTIPHVFMFTTQKMKGAPFQMYIFLKTYNSRNQGSSLYTLKLTDTLIVLCDLHQWHTSEHKISKSWSYQNFSKSYLIYCYNFVGLRFSKMKNAHNSECKLIFNTKVILKFWWKICIEHSLQIPL